MVSVAKTLAVGSTATAGTGTITSPMWHTQNLFNNVIGPLPRTSGTFTTYGGTLMIFVSGSAFAGTTATTIGMNVQVDGVTKFSEYHFLQ